LNFIVVDWTRDFLVPADRRMQACGAIWRILLVLSDSRSSQGITGGKRTGDRSGSSTRSAKRTS